MYTKYDTRPRLHLLDYAASALYGMGCIKFVIEAACHHSTFWGFFWIAISAVLCILLHWGEITE